MQNKYFHLSLLKLLFTYWSTDFYSFIRILCLVWVKYTLDIILSQWNSRMFRHRLQLIQVQMMYGNHSSKHWIRISPPLLYCQTFQFSDTIITVVISNLCHEGDIVLHFQQFTFSKMHFISSITFFRKLNQHNWIQLHLFLR